MDVDREFPDIVRAHQDAVYSIALRLTPGRADAEDAAQDVFVRAYRALQEYDEARRMQLRVLPWLASITLNVCRNRARTAQRRPATVALEEQHDERLDRAQGGRDLATLAEDRESAREIASALRQLSAPQRQAVVLHHAGGLTYREVADALHRPEGTVKADVHRGLLALRALLTPKDLPA